MLEIFTLLDYIECKLSNKLIIVDYFRRNAKEIKSILHQLAKCEPMPSFSITYFAAEITEEKYAEQHYIMQMF